MEENVSTVNDKQLSKPWLFQPGQVANPKGRTPGSRNKLGEAFIAALHDDFMENGPVVIENVRINQPAQYLKVIAAVIPKEFHVKDTAFEGLSDAEFGAVLSAIRALFANGAEAAPRVIEGRAEAISATESDRLHGVHVPEVSDGSMSQGDS